MDFCTLKLILQLWRCNKIVNSPPCILLSCFKSVRPPGISALCIRIKITECIDKSTFQHLTKACSLFICKSGIFPVGLRILQVDLLMCHIEIPAADHRLTFLQFQQVCQKILFPVHTVFQSAQFTLGIWCIYSHQIKFFIFQGDHTSFFVMFLNSNSIRHRQWLFLCKNSSSGISPSVGIIPILIISRKFQLHLPLLAFRFLQAENIRIKCCKALFKPFANACTYTIYIP